MDLQKWLGAGSINIFGLPLSGKDTQCQKLAEFVNGQVLSSGEIIRKMEAETKTFYTSQGDLAPTNVFYHWVLPYFEKREFWDKPLILSSIGRWAGEEDAVMHALEGAGHPLKAVIYLQLTDADIKQRWQAAQKTNDRGNRPDDANLEILKKRITEFQQKTLPVLRRYRELGLLLIVDGRGTRDAVFEHITDSLIKFAQKHS